MRRKGTYAGILAIAKTVEKVGNPADTEALIGGLEGMELELPRIRKASVRASIPKRIRSSRCEQSVWSCSTHVFRQPLDRVAILRSTPPTACSSREDITRRKSQLNIPHNYSQMTMFENQGR